MVGSDQSHNHTITSPLLSPKKSQSFKIDHPGYKKQAGYTANNFYTSTRNTTRRLKKQLMTTLPQDPMGYHSVACHSTIYATAPRRFLYFAPVLKKFYPKHWRRTPPWKSKNLPFGANISWTEVKFKIRLGGVNCIEITYWMIPYTTMWLWQHELQGGVLYLFRNLHVVFNVRV